MLPRDVFYAPGHLLTSTKKYKRHNELILTIGIRVYRILTVMAMKEIRSQR